MNLGSYTINAECTILEAMKLIELNKKGFVIVLKNKFVIGTVTDGDIRRALIHGYELKTSLEKMINPIFEKLTLQDSFHVVVEKFKSGKIDFLPILSENNELVNVITKQQFHEILLQGYEFSLAQDFSAFDNSLVIHEIYDRPWGFYKTVFLSEIAQAKIIHVHPNQQLSLQYHKKREEHWVIVKGCGEMTIGESVREVAEGAYIFIPKGCAHRVKNTSITNPLIISEVQLGTYFGEDDIIRLQDDYGRS